MYQVDGGFLEPNSRHRNTLQVPVGKGLQGPESNPPTGWEHQVPGTSSSNKAVQKT